MKKNLYFVFLVAVAFVALSGCKKTPDYEPNPYKCDCGSVTWNGNTSYDVLDANFIHPAGFDSRRYYITAKVPLDQESGPHNLNTWIEIADVSTGFNHQLSPVDTLYEFTAQIDEFNVNDPLDTLRRFVPVQGLVTINPPALLGGQETVKFIMVLNEVINGVPSGANINYTGSFTVEIDPPF